MEDYEIEELKLKINNLIWVHGDANLTLGEAENRACNIFDAIKDKPSKENESCQK